MKLLVSDYAGDCTRCGRCMVRADWSGELPDFVARANSLRSVRQRCKGCEAAHRAEAEAEREKKVIANAIAAGHSYAGWVKARRARLAKAERVRRLREAGVLT